MTEDQEALAAVAAECQTLDETISFLVGWRHYQRSVLRGALEATGKKSSTTLVPGFKIGLRPRKVMVCTCHLVVPYACPNYDEGNTTLVAWLEDGESLYVSHAE